MRVKYTAWGSGIENLDMPAYAVLDNDSGDTKIDALVRAIERKTRLISICRPRPNGVTNNRQQYEITLGKRAYGGGFNSVTRVWVAVETEGGS